MSLLKHKQTVHTHTHTKGIMTKRSKSILSLFSVVVFQFSHSFGLIVSIVGHCVCVFHSCLLPFLICLVSLFTENIFILRGGSSATQKLKIQSTNKNLLSFGPKLSGSSSSRSAVGKTFFAASVIFRCVGLFAMRR